MKKRNPVLFILFFLLPILACNLPPGNSSNPSLVDRKPLSSEGVVEDEETANRASPLQTQTDDITSGVIGTPSPPPATDIPQTPSSTPAQEAASTAPEDDSPVEPTIAYFRSNAAEVDPGDMITLEWSTSEAITVTLWHLTPTGQFGQFWDVAASGAFDYVINEQERNRSRFALFASAGTDTSTMATLSIAIRCPDSWFFENEPDICPRGPALSSGGAVQNFERGTMIWVEAEDHIYVLFADGHSPGWSRYVDEWDPGEPDVDPTLHPPEGHHQPVRGFGLLWREEPSLRDRLGWAVDEESGYQTLLQRTSFAKYNETYILAPDGSIWRLLPERSDWEIMEGP